MRDCQKHPLVDENTLEPNCVGEPGDCRLRPAEPLVLLFNGTRSDGR